MDQEDVEVIDQDEIFDEVIVPVVWFPISEIMKWGSVDSKSTWDKDAKLIATEKLEQVLDRKKKEESYYEALEFLKKDGFREPLVHVNYCCSQGDGHHRLAAAIDLGFRYVPYVVQEDTFLDETLWEGDLVHPENPIFQ